MPVSHDDLERLTRGFELYNAGHFDAVMNELAPDVVLERDRLPPLQGRDAVRENWEPDAFEWQRIEPGSWEAQGDKVLAPITVRSKGAGSSIELELSGWMVVTFENGLAVHMLMTRDEARARQLFES